MSRRAGQLSTRGFAAGLFVALAAIAGIVALSDWLVGERAQFERLGAPGPTAPLVECPEVGSARPVPVSAVALVDCPDRFDGVGVRYTGEVVGVILRRPTFAWVQLNDDAYALAVGPLPEHRAPLGANSGMAVAVPLELADAIAMPGSHRAHGDVVEVTGTFLRAGDGGAPMIEAHQARIVRPGRALGHPVSGRRLVVAGSLAMVTALLALIVWRRRP